MTVFEDQTFEGFYDFESGATFAKLEFRRCEFVRCDISAGDNPKRRSIVRDVHIDRCKVVGYGMGAAVLENVKVNGLETDRLFQTWGAVFKHVTLDGQLGKLMFSNYLCPGASVTPSMQTALAEANAAFYATVDWALDISGGSFRSCTIRGVPARLIRRDPETQVVVTRQRAQEGAWRDLDLEKTYWGAALDFLLLDPMGIRDPDVVLVAPKRDPSFRELLRGLHLLRRAGVAEPD